MNFSLPPAARHCLFLGGLLFLLALFSRSPVLANDLQSQLNSMFGALSSSNDPRAYKTQRRGVLSGGSFYARNRINETHLVGFSPPKAEAGCGGLDLHGGSFSFINGQEFNQLIRNIAGNASGYLIGLAISAMNEKAYQHIHALQQMIQQMNSQLSNSCQLGQGLANMLPMPSAMEKFKTEASLNLIKKGVTDSFNAFTGKDLPKKDPIEGWKTQRSEDSKKKLLGNLVWKALQKSKVVTDLKFQKAVMSMTGTVVVTEKATPAGKDKKADNGESGSVSSPQEGLRFIAYPGNLLTLKDLMDGSQNSKKLDIYTCDENADCQLLSTETTELTGLTKQLGQKLGKLVTCWRNNSCKWEDEEDHQKFIQGLPVGVGGMLLNLALLDEDLALEFAERVAPHVAFYILYRYIEDLHRVVQTLINLEGSDHPLAEQLVAILADSRQALAEERQVLNHRHGRFGELVLDYRNLMALAKRPRYQPNQGGDPDHQYWLPKPVKTSGGDKTSSNKETSNNGS